MSDIKTWHQRAMAHPDHQSGMISEDMIRARMCEEIDDLRAEIERLRAQLEERYVSMRVRQLEEALDAERQTTRRLREALKQFRCSCDPGECVEYGERWASVCEKGEARDVLEGKP